MSDALQFKHPNYRIMDLPKEELLLELSGWNRQDMISWLKWNDPNGVYDDDDSLRELNNIMSREEGIEIIVRQITEG